MRHPLQKVPRGGRLPLLMLLLALTVGLMAVLYWTLRGERYGIVALELAGTVKEAGCIVAAWDDSGAWGRALFHVRLDYLFLVVYSTTVGLACILASETFRPFARWAATLGVALAWVQWLAALLDTVENVALIEMLRGSITRPWPQIARWSAIPKFVLVGAGAVYVTVGACVCLATKNAQR